MNEKLFIAFLSKTLNMTQKQVADLVKTEDGEVKDDALDILLKHNSDHIKTLVDENKPDTKEFFNNGFAKAQKEVMGNHETEVMKHYGITSKKQGLELIDEVIAEKTKALEQKEITADEVKKHDVFRNMVTNLNTEKETAVQEITTNFEKQIEGFKKAETFKTISSKADIIINELNPIFSTNPAIAQNQRKTIHDALSSRNFEIQDSGTIVPVDAENKALANEHGHPIEFKTVVTDVTSSLFDLKKSNERNSPGDVTDDDTPDTAWTGTAPKNDKEYLKMMEGATTQEERKQITEAYEKADS